MRTRGAPARVLQPVLLGAAFLVVHVVLGRLNVTGVPVAGGLRQDPAGDVTGAYRFWIEYWQQQGVLVGIGTDWVYPVLALVPMIASAVLGVEPRTYLLVWLVIVSLLDAGALVLLARRRPGLAWWWLGFTALLGPVALTRIDAVALPIAIAGVLAAVRRPAVASALLTVAAWIKVWPAALVAALVIAVRRGAAVIGAAVAVSAAVIAVALLLGAQGRVLSFITAQASRGIQVEAPIALPWLWSAATGLDDTRVYYDTSILTFQVEGDGVVQAAAVMTPVLAIGVLAVVVLGVVARRRGADPGELLALTSLGLVSALIALNKVGSPQYLTWFVAPVLLGLLASPARFRFPAVLVLVMAGLTQVIYPWSYNDVTGTVPATLAVLTMRNALELVLLVWCLVALRSARAVEPAVEGVATG